MIPYHSILQYLRYHQVDTTLNADAEEVDVTVPQPKACKIYYGSCGKIDQHNRHRQATLKLETKLTTHDWSKRVNMTLFGMTVVHSWLAFTGCTNATETQSDFYTLLAEELIDNSYDDRLVALRRRQPVTCAITSPTLAVGTGVPRAGVGSHITPTKRRKVVKGVVTSYSEQGRCKECHKKTTNCCSVCVDAMEEDPDNPLKSAWICSAKKGKMCFANHLRRCHGI